MRWLAVFMVATESDDHIHTGNCTWCRQVDSERRLLIRHIRLSGVWVIEPRPSHSRVEQISSRSVTLLRYSIMFANTSWFLSIWAMIPLNCRNLLGPGIPSSRPGAPFQAAPQHKQAVTQCTRPAKKLAIAATTHSMQPAIAPTTAMTASAMQANMPVIHEMMIPITFQTQPNFSWVLATSRSQGILGTLNC